MQPSLPDFLSWQQNLKNALFETCLHLLLRRRAQYAVYTTEKLSQQSHSWNVPFSAVPPDQCVQLYHKAAMKYLQK